MRLGLSLVEIQEEEKKRLSQLVHDLLRTHLSPT